MIDGFFRRAIYLFIVAGLLLLRAPALALAQDQNNPEVLRKQLADALAQLKAAQDRKNELGNENEKLKAQVVTMQKQLEDLQRASAAFAETTYDLRAREAAWAAFVAQDPSLKARWELFLELSPAEFRQDQVSRLLRTPPPPSIATTSPSTAPVTTQSTPPPLPSPTSEPTPAPASAPAPAPASAPATSPTATQPATKGT